MYNSGEDEKVFQCKYANDKIMIIKNFIFFSGKSAHIPLQSVRDYRTCIKISETTGEFSEQSIYTNFLQLTYLDRWTTRSCTKRIADVARKRKAPAPPSNLRACCINSGAACNQQTPIQPFSMSAFIRITSLFRTDHDPTHSFTSLPSKYLRAPFGHQRFPAFTEGLMQI